LKVKRKVYPVEEFARRLELGKDVYLLSIHIDEMAEVGDETEHQFVTIRYIVNEQK